MAVKVTWTCPRCKGTVSGRGVAQPHPTCAECAKNGLRVDLEGKIGKKEACCAWHAANSQSKLSCTND